MGAPQMTSERCADCVFWCADDRETDREAPCLLIGRMGYVRVIKAAGQDIITSRDFACNNYESQAADIRWSATL